MNLRAAVACCTTLVLAAGCSGATEQPPGTVGIVPVASEAGTLLPVLADTAPPDITATVPPATCSTATRAPRSAADDFRSVTIGGVATGTLTGTSVLSEDTCSYDLRLPRRRGRAVEALESATASTTRSPLPRRSTSSRASARKPSASPAATIATR